MGRAERLAAFQGAYQRFLAAVGRVPEGSRGERLETSAPRDLMAQLIGWNRLVQGGCDNLRRGEPPSYHTDAENEYARVQQDSVRQFGPLDHKRMTQELQSSREELLHYLEALEPAEWNVDRGIRHPEGGPATVRRELEGLTRRYLDATDEILLWLDSHGAA